MPGMKFCESCGAKIEALPACPQCGASLNPDAKFCESCGKPVTAAAAQPSEAQWPVLSKPATPEAAAPPAAPVAPPAPEKEQKQPETRPEPVPEEKPAPAPAAVKEPPKPEKVKEVPKETGPKKPMPQTTMIIAGIIVLALLGAIVYFVVLPMMSGSGTMPHGPSGQTPVPTGAAGPSATSATGSGTVSLTAGPTQVLPKNRGLIIDIERDAISSIITVTFQGGEGQYGVRELVVTLTRSDGTVERKSFKPEYRGIFITLQGTEKTDRVEVTANFYNGESYKVVDQIFEYKKRVGSY